MLTRSYFVGIAALLGMTALVAGAAGGTAGTLAWSVVAGMLAVAACRVLADPAHTFHELGPLVLAAGSLTTSCALRAITAPQAWNWPEPLAILVGVLVAWGTDAAVAPAIRRLCFICKQPIGTEPSTFTCPRCGETICARPSCWDGRKVRCRSCDDRDVVIFPADETWWSDRLGSRVDDGACGTCYKEAYETDLRACGRCGWTYCRRCWDTSNGRCAHCDWTMGELPAALRSFMPSADRDPRWPPRR